MGGAVGTASRSVASRSCSPVLAAAARWRAASSPVAAAAPSAAESLRAEYANLRAGVRDRAVSSEHRVNTEGCDYSENPAEYDRGQLSACPLDR